MRICIQSLEKMVIRANKIFSSKIEYGYVEERIYEAVMKKSANLIVIPI